MKTGLGLHNQDTEAPVSLVKWKYEKNAVAEAIELCDGFKNLDPNMKVLIKPNLVSWVDKYRFAPFGVLTTSVVLEGLVRALKDFGVGDITIAEGSARQEEMGSETYIIYERLNYAYLSKQYGVRLVDLNQEDHVRTALGPFTLRIAKRVLDAEFMINVPVLKTHNATKISMGFKNLKGCLAQSSKKACHNPDHPVDEYLVELGSRLYPHLVVTDGIYAMERGPMYTGHAHRTDLVMASRDMFSNDCVGATLVGFQPEQIGHLKGFAGRNGRSLSVDDIEVRGLNPAECALQLEYDTPWSTDGLVPQIFEKQGIGGFQMRNPGQSMCTGCSKVFPAVLVMLLGAYEGKPFDNFEILSGKAMRPSGTAKTTIFMGDCNYAINRNAEGVQKGVWLKGCPPRIDETIRIFNEQLGVKLKEENNARFFAHKVKVYDKLGYPYSDYYFDSTEKKP
ncbi:MAG: DUF362 domain-containing protein [Deltaproteobacteria bacterium]|nr:DUF362 domain-containing protein [Deltaproteobacteria bacterium]MBW2120240.1 DUF362 domain-containing protein [Deltaproteobacteria bacterium]